MTIQSIKRLLLVCLGLVLLLVCLFLLMPRNRHPAELISAAKTSDSETTASPRPEIPIPSVVQIEGALSRAVQMKSAVDERNVAINFWGKVVDQDGKPLFGVVITAQVRESHLLPPSRIYTTHKPLTATTGTDGVFSITQARGDVLSISGLVKDGYVLSPRAITAFDYTRGATANSGSPVIYRMWKSGVPQALVRHRFSRTGIPCDGTPVFFDLITGEKSREVGDLKVRLVRDPVELPARNVRYAWRAELEIVRGGLLDTSDEFMHLAPEGGYVEKWHCEMSKDALDWTPILANDFFVKLRNGTVFGRIQVRLTTDYQPPPTGLTMESIVNPSGSRSLE